MALNQKKSGKKETTMPSRNKQYILLGVVVGLFAFAGVMFFSYSGGSGGGGGPSQPATMMEPQFGVGPGGPMGTAGQAIPEPVSLCNI